MELLLISQNTPHPDPIIDTKRYKIGDVVVACPDGWNWGTEELANPLFRIIKLPGIALAEGEAFLGSEKDTDPANPSRMLQRRAFGLDPTLLPAAALNWWNDDTRKVQTVTLNITIAQIRALKKAKAKAKIADPNILGDETPNVL